jgi:hypothetical protein
MWEELLGCLDDFADLVGSEGNHAVAVRILAAVSAARERLKLTRSPRAQVDAQARDAQLRQVLSEAVFNSAWADGEAWELADAIRAAHSPQHELYVAPEVRDSQIAIERG